MIRAPASAAAERCAVNTPQSPDRPGVTDPAAQGTAITAGHAPPAGANEHRLGSRCSGLSEQAPVAGSPA